jgi:phosphoglycerate kinase
MLSQILLLENLRYHPEEEQNDAAFGAQLFAGVDVYVNDAFSCSHRAHSSITSITTVPIKVLGLAMAAEVSFLGYVRAPSRPFVAIVGGSKVSTKLQVLHSLIQKVDKLLIGGGMVFTFEVAMGNRCGDSIVETSLVAAAAGNLTTSNYKCVTHEGNMALLTCACHSVCD